MKLPVGGGCKISLAQHVRDVPDAYEHGNRSTVQLLAQTGYLDEPQLLTLGDGETALQEDPNHAELWLERGMHQRLAAGWSVEHSGDQ